MFAALIIPTTTNVALPIDQRETYCGAYLSPLSGDTVAGEVDGKAKFTQTTLNE